MSSAGISNSEMVSNNSLQAVLATVPVPAPLAAQIETSDGSRAIEVAAMFDGAVQEVRHFDNPAAGRVLPATKGLLFSAGAALIGTLGLFASSVAEVASEKAAEAAQTTPSRAPQRSGHGKDGAAGGLLFYGLGALYLGLQRRSNERRENEFTIGSDANTTFQIDSSALPCGRFPLVRSTGTDYEFLFTNQMAGELSLNGKSTPLHELQSQALPAAGLEGAYALAIPDGARLSLSHQGCSFLIRSVPRPRHYPVPLQLDWRAQSYTGAVLAGAAALIAIMFSAPPDPHSLALDSFSNEQLMRYMVKAPEVKDENPDWLKQIKEKKEAPSPSSTKTASARPTPVRPLPFKPIASNKAPSAVETQQIARSLAGNVGVLGLIRSGAIPGLAALTSGGSALGDAAKDAIDGLDGVPSGDAYGTPNGSLVGTIPGGFPGDRTIGGGPIGTGFRPAGPGPKVALGPHQAKAPTEWKLEAPTVSPGMDREVIRRVIRGHMNEVKFCYEKELTRDSHLNGRLVVKFAINGIGSVASSFIESSSLHNPTAEQCIANAVHRWQFPKPSGGLVVVSYPFVLKAASE